MVAQVCNPSMQEVGGPEVQSHPQLHKELEPSLGYKELNPDTAPNPATQKREGFRGWVLPPQQEPPDPSGRGFLCSPLCFADGVSISFCLLSYSEKAFFPRENPRSWPTAPPRSLACMWLSSCLCGSWDSELLAQEQELGERGDFSETPQHSLGSSGAGVGGGSHH